MSLSNIDTSVYYDVIIPSTKKKTSFRPFRVREERALLTAQESESENSMLVTLEEVVRACVKKCPEHLTTFDIEYLFVKIRSKSVGEESTVMAECSHCNTNNRVTVNLENVSLSNESQERKLKISKDLVVVMKYPSIDEVSKVMDLQDEDQSLAGIAAAIETIYYKDQVYHTSETDIKEIHEFILNRSDDEMLQIIEFIENVPTVVLETEFECKQCASMNVLKLKTLSDFF